MFNPGDKVKCIDSGGFNLSPKLQEGNVFTVKHLVNGFLSLEELDGLSFLAQRFELVEDMKENLKEDVEHFKEALANKILKLLDEKVKYLSETDFKSKEEVFEDYDTELNELKEVLKLLGYNVHQKTVYELVELV